MESWKKKKIKKAKGAEGNSIGFRGPEALLGNYNSEF